MITFVKSPLLTCRIVVDEDVQLLVLGACEYVLLHGKWDFEDVIKVEMGEVILDYPSEPNLNTRVLKHGRRRHRGQSDVLWEILGLPLLALKREEWAINQRMWVASTSSSC